MASNTASLSKLLGGWVLILPGVLLLLAACTVNLTARDQTLVAIAGVVIFLLANRFRGRIVNLFLIALSMAISFRYVFWRLTETLHFDNAVQLVLGGGLLAAEAYAISVLILSYFQTAWPLNRKPIAMPPDLSAWPHVDVYVPTYNESLDIVRTTVFACMQMDWPADRMRVYILDDGRRDLFREFAESVGCGYLTRSDNAHAKAGNLNAAIRVTDGEYIAIFDCDHVPTRAFLQLSMGWMVADPKLALMQLPHYFYSPDPFQRNLRAGTRVPPEGNLFYGLLPPGNDYWNAAFFCGSCAILRRTAIESIGGFAVETVTEDAHTMLKMHRRGWDSAYLRLPLAAGLATERLMLHIGQRTRWARGMIQILRIDNPMLGPGLNLGQRLCYLQAMSHFLFAVPRLVFLTSPLAYLLLFQNIFPASPLAILAYGLPHIFHSVATNSRLQRNWRHSFWSEIYETVLALWLVRLTLATLWNPRLGKFNVTDKGGLLDEGYYDWKACYPNIILASLLALGVVRGLASLAFFTNDTLASQALAMNSLWAFFSLLTVLAALAVGLETRQVRARARVDVRLPVVIHLADGRAFAATTREISQQGCSLALARPAGVDEGAAIAVEFAVAGEDLVVPSQQRQWRDSTLQVAFKPDSLADEAAIVRVLFGRADAWLEWSDYADDQAMASLWRVLVSIGGLFRRAPVPGRRRRVAAGCIALAMLLPHVARAQSQVTVRPVPDTGNGMLQGVPEPPVAPPPSVGAPVAPPIDAPGVHRLVLTLGQLGAQGPLTLRGNSPLQGVQFGIRQDEVVVAAELSLSGAMSPSLIPEFSNDTVTLNEQYVGTIPVNRGQPRFNALVMPIDPVFFQDNNRLNIRFAGRYTRDCNDPMSGLLWSTVSDGSRLTLTLQRLPPARELSRLPLPFFDPRERQALVLPFVVQPGATNEALQAAAIAASWFGTLAAYRGASFPVGRDAPSDDNAVLIYAGAPPAGYNLDQPDGPTLAAIANPRDPSRSILVIGGRDGAETIVAATALAVASHALSGNVAAVQMPEMAPRLANDAPLWIPSNRPVRLGELVDTARLQVSGYTGTVHVPFRTAPDLYTWRDRGFPVAFTYRAPPGPVIDLGPSRVDVAINGAYLKSVSLAPPGWSARWLDSVRGLAGQPAALATASIGLRIRGGPGHGSPDHQFAPGGK